MRKPKIITRALSEREEEMLKNAFGRPRFELFEAYQKGTPVKYIGIKKGCPVDLTIWNVKKMLQALKKFEKKENTMFQIGSPYDEYPLTYINEITYMDELIPEKWIQYLATRGIVTFQQLRDVICYNKEWLPLILRSCKSARKLVKIFKKYVGAAIYE